MKHIHTFESFLNEGTGHYGDQIPVIKGEKGSIFDWTEKSKKNIPAWTAEVVSYYNGKQDMGNRVGLDEVPAIEKEVMELYKKNKAVNGLEILDIINAYQDKKVKGVVK